MDLNPKLSEEILELSKTLPLKPFDVTLTGKNIRLIPVDVESDCQALYNASNGSPITINHKTIGAYDPSDIWKNTDWGPYPTIEAYKTHLIEQTGLPDCLLFCIQELNNLTPIGTVAYKKNKPNDLMLEIGTLWVAPVYLRSGVTSEALFLLLDHIFAIGYRRIEYRTEKSNFRSFGAAKKLGFQIEIESLNYWIVKNHCSDAYILVIFSFEWESIKNQIRDKIFKENN